MRHREGQRHKELQKPRFTQREVWRKGGAIEAWYKKKQRKRKEGIGW